MPYKTTKTEIINKVSASCKNTLKEEKEHFHKMRGK